MSGSPKNPRNAGRKPLPEHEKQKPCYRLAAWKIAVLEERGGVTAYINRLLEQDGVFDGVDPAAAYASGVRRKGKV